MKSERSFSLIETMIALGLIAGVLAEVISLQGNSIDLSSYERKATQATWIANAILAKLEWGYSYYDTKEMKQLPIKNQDVPEELCSKELGCDFKFNLTVENSKLPFVQMIAQQVGGIAEGFEDIVAKQINNFLGEEIMHIAHVEVLWPAGVKQRQISMSSIFTNQKKLDEEIFKQNPLPSPWAQEKKKDKKGKGKGKDKGKTDKKEEQKAGEKGTDTGKNTDTEVKDS